MTFIEKCWSSLSFDN